MILANLTVNNKTKEKSQVALVADHLEVLDTIKDSIKEH